VKIRACRRQSVFLFLRRYFPPLFFTLVSQTAQTGSTRGQFKVQMSVEVGEKRRRRLLTVSLLAQVIEPLKQFSDSEDTADGNQSSVISALLVSCLSLFSL